MAWSNGLEVENLNGAGHGDVHLRLREGLKWLEQDFGAVSYVIYVEYHSCGVKLLHALSCYDLENRYVE